MRVIVCAAGFKGAVFLDGLLDHSIDVTEVWTYQDPSDMAASFLRIERIAEGHGVPLKIGKRPEFMSDDIVLIVGWQYLLIRSDATAIVFHDSLLPAYRGFSPSVNALIKGEPRIGATALFLDERADHGPIIDQRAFDCLYPVKIEDILRRQASLMKDMAIDIVKTALDGPLISVPQDDALATYSIWRDEADYLIDWSRGADEISRFVDAVGFPYAGARSYANGEAIIIRHVTAQRDLRFEIRQAGKIWQIVNGCPLVVCGDGGLIRIDDAIDLKGIKFVFNKLRTRFDRCRPASD